MDLSGMIFVVLAVAWVVYLVPKALKHHDEVARTRSIDRFSNALRVLARREPVNRRDARLVVTSPRGTGAGRTSPAAATTRVSAEVTTETAAGSTTEKVAAVAVPVPATRVRARREAARVAARRRRRVLTFLLVCTVGTAGAGYLGYAPWWCVAVPGGLTASWLVLCRTQVRRETLRDFEVLAGVRPSDEAAVESVLPHRAMQTSEQPASQPIGGDEPAEHGQVAAPAGEDDVEDTIGIPVPVLDTVVVTTEDGGTLWDPLPVTLPTYVGKPQAKRTVRTIDLGEPGTWTSGRTAEDAALVAQAEAERSASDQSAEDAADHRAVGS